MTHAKMWQVLESLTRTLAALEEEEEQFCASPWRSDCWLKVRQGLTSLTLANETDGFSEQVARNLRMVRDELPRRVPSANRRALEFAELVTGLSSLSEPLEHLADNTHPIPGSLESVRDAWDKVWQRLIVLGEEIRSQCAE